MADENPPATPESGEDATKNDTIRITLPPKTEQPAVKRETVRINVPGKPVAPPGTAPKKETSKLPTLASEGAAPSGPPKPPGPPRPPGALGVPPSKPAVPGMPPPKPPAPAGRPTVPLKPAPAPAGAEAGPQKAASPKKETARITLPAEGAAKPALPKATVKMQQTQPLARPQSGIQPVPASIHAAPVPLQQVSSGDAAVNPLSIAALVLALAALATVYLAFNAAAPPQ